MFILDNPLPDGSVWLVNATIPHLLDIQHCSKDGEDLFLALATYRLYILDVPHRGIINQCNLTLPAQDVSVWDCQMAAVKRIIKTYHKSMQPDLTSPGCVSMGLSNGCSQTCLILYNHHIQYVTLYTLTHCTNRY